MDIKQDPGTFNHQNQYLKLLQEFRLLHLLYHRNKNQHRVSQWWKYFNILKRSCSQVLELIQKRELKKKSELIRLYRLVNNFFKKISRKIYYEFNGIIALDQFVTLGVVLISLLSRVYSTYREINHIYLPRFGEIGCRSVVVSSNMIEDEDALDWKTLESQVSEELGEEIEDKLGESKNEPGPPRTLANLNMESHKPRRKKVKKKKAKSAIDGIFG